MILEIKSKEELLAILQGLPDDEDRIDFIYQYIDEHAEATNIVLASLYEQLALLLVRSERSNPEIFEKAGDFWSRAWVNLSQENSPARQQRHALTRSKENYQEAMAIYAQTNSSYLADQVKVKLDDIKLQLRSFSPIGKRVMFAGGTVSLVSAFIFLTNTITGFAVAAGLTQAVSAGVGVSLILIGIALFFFGARW